MEPDWSIIDQAEKGSNIPTRQVEKGSNIPKLEKGSIIPIVKTYYNNKTSRNRTHNKYESRLYQRERDSDYQVFEIQEVRSKNM